jgi:lipopolysaccharide biosynthesis regulator YciM
MGMDGNTIPLMESKMKMLNKQPWGKERTMLRNEVQKRVYRKSGYRYKRCAYGRKENNKEGFIIRWLTETSTDDNNV